MRNKIVILMLVVLLCCGGLSQAAPITISITGNVTSAGGSALPSTIHVGDIFTGTYTYDGEAINTSTYSNIGKYMCDSPCGIRIFLNGFEFKTDPTQGRLGIDIWNDVTSNGTNDSYYVHSGLTAYTNGLWIGDISWNLNDSTHTAISSVDLPVTTPVLSAWNYNYLHINGGDRGFGYVDFYIGGIVTRVTPEPFTGILLAMGAFFLRRKR
jgi:hypothetical protein